MGIDFNKAHTAYLQYAADRQFGLHIIKLIMRLNKPIWPPFKKADSAIWQTSTERTGCHFWVQATTHGSTSTTQKWMISFMFHPFTSDDRKPCKDTSGVWLGATQSLHRTQGNKCDRSLKQRHISWDYDEWFEWTGPKGTARDPALRLLPSASQTYLTSTSPTFPQLLRSQKSRITGNICHTAV